MWFCVSTDDQYQILLLLLLLLSHFSHVRVWPHRRQPTSLLCPQDSPGKNTGVGCHFLLQCMKVKSESEVTQSCPTHHDPMDCSPPDSSVYGILQARVLEWVAIAFSNTFGKWYVIFCILWQIKDNIKLISPFLSFFFFFCNSLTRHERMCRVITLWYFNVFKMNIT